MRGRQGHWIAAKGVCQDDKHDQEQGDKQIGGHDGPKCGVKMAAEKQVHGVSRYCHSGGSVFAVVGEGKSRVVCEF